MTRVGEALRLGVQRALRAVAYTDHKPPTLRDWAVVSTGREATGIDPHNDIYANWIRREGLDESPVKVRHMGPEAFLNGGAVTPEEQAWLDSPRTPSLRKPLQVVCDLVKR